MHNFNRALKIALAHRLNVVTCILTATVVAILWGGSLTAVFPVVEVIMNDHALPDWIDQKIAEAQTEVKNSQRWTGQLEKLQGKDAEQIQQNIQAEIKLRQAELEEHKKNVNGVWNDVQIAEKTRLTNDIDHLD